MKLPIFGNKTSNFWRQNFQFISSFQFLATKLLIYFQLPTFGNKTSNLFPASNFWQQNFQFISSFQFLATTSYFRQRKLPIFGNKTSNFLALKLLIYFQLPIFG